MGKKDAVAKDYMRDPAIFARRPRRRGFALPRAREIAAPRSAWFFETSYAAQRGGADAVPRDVATASVRDLSTVALNRFVLAV